MEQYEKGGPETKKELSSTKSPEIRHLQEQVAEQMRLIKDLQKEIRQLKSRLDRHAEHLNKQSRG